MDIDHGTEKILDLVRKAYEGKVMLPDFQRNFIWERQNIEEFIESLLENVFVGTFLILNTSKGKEPFKCIFVQGAEKVNPNIKENPEKIILNGQQRLTSLFYAIYDPDTPLKNTELPYVFFIDLEKLAEDNIDELVFSYPKEHRFYKYLLNNVSKYDIEKLKEKKIIPLTMFQDLSEFDDIWYENFKFLFNKEESIKIKKYLKNIFDYDLITLSLPPKFNEEPEKIVVLFEKLNRTGIKLSTYDILVARLYKFINLREEWEILFSDSKNYHNILKFASFEMENTKVPFSFIQALVLSKDKSIRDKVLIKLDEKNINKNEYKRVIEIAENKVFKILFDIHRFGICDNIHKWLPYSTVIIPLLALYLKHKNVDSKKIDIWYWSVVFTESYSGTTESKIMKDFREVSKWFEDDSAEPEIVKDLKEQIQKEIFSLKNVKKPNSSLYRGVFNLIFKNNPVDFYEPDNIAYEKLEDHHIFPKSFLKLKDIDIDPDIVLNRTLIFEETNKRISNKAPADYIKDMIEIQMKKNMSYENAEMNVKKLLEKHFVNSEMYEILKSIKKELTKEQIKEN
ncbi:MAG: GmrSD restriction endonuclease domain-containing protein [Caldisericia bacterium]